MKGLENLIEKDNELDMFANIKSDKSANFKYLLGQLEEFAKEWNVETYGTDWKGQPKVRRDRVYTVYPS